MLERHVGVSAVHAGPQSKQCKGAVLIWTCCASSDSDVANMVAKMVTPKPGVSEADEGMLWSHNTFEHNEFSRRTSVGLHARAGSRRARTLCTSSEPKERHSDTRTDSALRNLRGAERKRAAAKSHPGDSAAARTLRLPAGRRTDSPGPLRRAAAETRASPRRHALCIGLPSD